MLRKKDPPYHLVEDAVDALLAHAEAVHNALPDDYHEEIGTEIMADQERARRDQN